MLSLKHIRLCILSLTSHCQISIGRSPPQALQSSSNTLGQAVIHALEGLEVKCLLCRVGLPCRRAEANYVRSGILDLISPAKASVARGEIPCPFRTSSYIRLRIRRGALILHRSFQLPKAGALYGLKAAESGQGLIAICRKPPLRGWAPAPYAVQAHVSFIGKELKHSHVAGASIMPFIS